MMAQLIGSDRSTITATVPATIVHSPRRPEVSNIGWLAGIVFMIQFGVSLTDIPTTRLLQDIICHQYYNDSSDYMLDETMCLGTEVQSRLNTIIIGLQIFSTVPGLLVALKFGSCVDKWGRKAVFCLCIGGIVSSQLWFISVCCAWRSVDLRLVWISSVPLLLGGGTSVMEGIVFVMVSDSTTKENRASMFQIIVCVNLLAKFAAPFMSVSLISASIWLPFSLALMLVVGGASLMAFVPETMPFLGDISTQTMCDGMNGVRQRGLRARFGHIGSFLRTTVGILNRPGILFLIPPAAFTVPIITTIMALVQKYIPNRFGWTAEQARMATAGQLGTTIVVLLGILPVLSYSCRFCGHELRDWELAAISAPVLVWGALLLGATVTCMIVGLVLLGLGAGLPALCRALLTGLVEENELGRLFGVLALLEMVGCLGIRFALSTLFQARLSMVANGADRSALSAPFAVAAWLIMVTSYPMIFRQRFRSFKQWRTDSDVETWLPPAGARSETLGLEEGMESQPEDKPNI